MVSTVFMPKLGLVMKKGTIISWVKKEGEMVQTGEKLAIMETEKVTAEIAAPANGTLLRILAPAKTSVAVGQPIAFIGEVGEPLPELVSPVTAAQPSAQTKEVPTSLPLSPQPEQRLRATPKAKRLAKEKGVDLAQMKGTGPIGMISEDDVLTYIEQMRSTSKSGLKVKEVRELSPTRSNIAERMTSSLQTMAQVTLTFEADASELVKAREANQSEIETKTGTHLSYTDLLVKVVARTLVEHPIMNSTLEDDRIKILEEINVGVAVASERGLTVPVIRAADEKSLAEITDAIKDFAERAREDRLEFEEVTGGTFTITNLGMTAVEAFTPIINPPQSAILGVGRIVNKPTAIDARVEVRPRMTFSLTFDHRVVDGYTAGEFLRSMVQIIESAHMLEEALK